jgi:uncharacterized protein YuzE
MMLQYYPETDMLYIQLGGVASAGSREVAPGIVLDFDAQDRVVGIEIEDASRFTDLTRLDLQAIPLASLLFERMAVA